MLSALKKLTKTGDDRCTAPAPMSSSLQKKFSKGVHFNMKILIKGDRNVGKSCLLQRLQGGPFIEEYVPTDQIQVAPIHWTYKNTDHIVKVEVWEVVDKGRTKKKSPLGLKLENQAAGTPAVDDVYEPPLLDATFLDVYKSASGVILMMDITKPWTFEYVIKELTGVPADLPVVVLGNHCDMQHHRQLHPHHIHQALHQAKLARSAPLRYAESSMRNGFGLRLLHKFLNVPFLRLQRTSLLEQLQRNQRDGEEAEEELKEFQNSDEADYNIFLEKLASKRRQSSTDTPARPSSDRSPSIVLGAGKPIVPPNVNPLVAHSLNPMGIKAQHGTLETPPPKQTLYFSPELLMPKHQISTETTPPRLPQDSTGSTPAGTVVSSSTGGLDEFYAGALDNSFLDDFTPVSNSNEVTQQNYDSDSENDNVGNPLVANAQDDLEDFDFGNPLSEKKLKSPLKQQKKQKSFSEHRVSSTTKEDESLRDLFVSSMKIRKDSINLESSDDNVVGNFEIGSQFPLWAGDSSARRSPEGGEDPDVPGEPQSTKMEKKHKKSKKSKEKGDSGDATERKEKKHKNKKSKSEKKVSHPQDGLLVPQPDVRYDYDDYDSI